MISAFKTCSADSQTWLKFRKKTNDTAHFRVFFLPLPVPIKLIIQIKIIQLMSLFPEALTYPDFFNHNLTDENRVLKIVTGEHCWARAFYYQLLKIILEIQSDQQKPVDYSELLVGLGKQIIPKIGEREVAEKMSISVTIVEKFLKYLSNNPELTFQQEINKNEEVDECLITILTQLVEESGFGEFTGEEKIKYLGQLFQLKMYQFDKGIKFEDSDTFIYFENNQCIYVAFLSMPMFQDQEDNKDNNSSIQKHNNFVPERIPEPQHKDEIDHTEGGDLVTTSLAPTGKPENSGYAEGNIPRPSPVDYLFNHKYRSTAYEPSLHVNKIESPNERPELSENNLEFTLGINPLKSDDSERTPKIMKIKHAETVESIQDSQHNKVKNRESIVEQINLQTHNNERNSDFFYKPTQIGLNSVPKSSVKKDPLDMCNDSQKGTDYKKFTDTRILNLLAEPYRSKVKMVKNRFINVRNTRVGLHQKPF